MILQEEFQGNVTVKLRKLQTLTKEFENLIMKDLESLKD